METALSLPEILERICDFSSQGTLARLIRTCRDFEEPSRRALWKELAWLDPLLGLLPESTWERGPGGRETVHRHPSPEDWARMRFYTSCITSVELHFKPRAMGSCEANNSNSDCRLRLLTSLSPPVPLSPMFPMLRAIRCDMFQRGVHAIIDTEIFCWVNGPSVTHLHFNLLADPWSHQNTVKFASSLSTLYPNATDVRIFIDVADYACDPRQGLVPLIFEGLFKSIRDWKDLVHGTFQTLDPPTFAHLSRLQSLTSLHLDMRSPVVPACLQEAEYPPNPFPSLTKIVLSSCFVDQLEEWLHPFHFSPRELLCSVERPASQHQSDLHDLCHWIAAKFCNRTLEAIVLRSAQGPQYECRENWMRPLFSFTHLRQVSLSHITWTLIDDDSLIELASSWPLLEWLDLNKTVVTSGEDDAIILPTFRGFLFLIKHCPYLRILNIVIDTRNSEWVDLQDPCDGAYNDGMVGLGLGNSLVEDRGRVARILSAIFPRLDEVYFYWSGEVVTVKLRGPDSEALAV